MPIHRSCRSSIGVIGMHDVVSRCLDMISRRGEGTFVKRDSPYTVEVRIGQDLDFRMVNVARQGGNIVSIDLDTGKMKFRINDRVDRQVTNTVLARMHVALYVMQRVPIADETFLNVGPFLDAHIDPYEQVISKRLGHLVLKGAESSRYIVASEEKIPRYQMIHVKPKAVEVI